MTNGTGSYSTIWTSQYPGSYLLQASYGGSSNYAASTSPSVSLTVTGTVNPNPTVLLTAPTSATVGQTVSLEVTVFNPTSALLNANVTVQISGPGNYVSFDVIQVKVQATSESTGYYDWTPPNQTGSYTVTVELLSTRARSSDMAAIQVAANSS